MMATPGKEMVNGKESLTSSEADGGTTKSLRSFAIFALAFQGILFVLFDLKCDYEKPTITAGGKDVDDGGVAFFYPMYQDVHVMIFVGFGFLMTFLKNHGFGSVGLNFMIAAFVIQWAIFCNGAFRQIWSGESGPIPVGMEALITADFAAGAVLISFGAILGRVSPFQLLVLAIFEIIFYNLNERIGDVNLKAADMGGSMYVHAFGAYFGLAASLALSRGKDTEYADHKKNGSTKTSDMFAMVGTLFLFIFWPSFTGALATGDQKYRVVVNTALSLAASCCVSFSLTVLFRAEKKFSMVDVQNATLAGGVAIGTASNLMLHPCGAMMIGIVAAFVSVIGYTKISPILESKLGLFDTCGVHNLHGMPGVLGGIAGAFCAAMATAEDYGGDSKLEEIYEGRSKDVDRSAVTQATFQLMALGASVFMAVVSGYISGLIVSMPVFGPVSGADAYEDTVTWEVEEDEEEGKSPGHYGHIQHAT